MIGKRICRESGRRHKDRPPGLRAARPQPACFLESSDKFFAIELWGDLALCFGTVTLNILRFVDVIFECRHRVPNIIGSGIDVVRRGGADVRVTQDALNHHCRALPKRYRLLLLSSSSLRCALPSGSKARI